MDSNAIALMATEVIAAFTVVLALASIYQGYLTRQSINLGRAEFNATHRPEIIVHGFAPQFNVIENAERIGASVWCFNKGRSDAINFEVNAVIKPMSTPTIGRLWPEIPTRAKTIARGGKHQFYIESEYTLSGEGIRQSCAGNERMFCVGTISYMDDAGTRCETGFCQIFDIQTQEWRSAKMPEFEYAY